MYHSFDHRKIKRELIWCQVNVLQCLQSLDLLGFIHHFQYPMYLFASLTLWWAMKKASNSSFFFYKLADPGLP